MADLTPGTSARKQSGRRYGPAPKASPHPEMQAPKPMDSHRRASIYIADGRQTPRRDRQFFRTGERNDQFLKLSGTKSGPTPKQKKVHRDAR